MESCNEPRQSWSHYRQLFVSWKLRPRSVFIVLWLLLCTARFADTLIWRVVLKVELDIFSGRPNPQWDLTETEEAELLLKLRALPIATGRCTIPQLGYRGFLLYSYHSKTSLQTWLRIGFGCVIDLRNPGYKYYEDTASIESWLIQNSIAHGHQVVVEQIRRT